MKTLGICWIVYGLFRLGMSVAGVLLAPTATVMFGALLTRVADPFTWMGFFHIWYVCWIGLSFVCGILGIVGGLALMRSPNGGKGSLSDLPVGIAIGVYTLIALLRRPASAEMVQDREGRNVRQDIS
jgi:hypothetical protein